MKNFVEMESVFKDVKAVWVDCGEGLCGDYNPEDAEDVHLLRFDVYIKQDENWEPVDNASYCTMMPINTDAEVLKKALGLIAKQYYDVLSLCRSNESCSVKRLGEKLSHIGPDDVKNYTL